MLVGRFPVFQKSIMINSDCGNGAILRKLPGLQFCGSRLLVPWRAIEGLAVVFVLRVMKYYFDTPTGVASFCLGM